MKNLYTVLLYILFSSTLCAQTWRELDSLCCEYAERKPDSAILFGTKAIESCIKEKGKSSIEYAICTGHIAGAYKNKNKLTIADSLYQESITIFKAINQTQNTQYSEIINDLAMMYKTQGRYTDAEPLFLEAKNLDAKLVGTNHPDYAAACNNLGDLYHSQGRYSEAEPLLVEARIIRFKALGGEHPEYAVSCNNLAALHKAQGRYEEAELLYIEAKNILAKIFGKEHAYYATACNNLAFLYKAQKRYKESELLYAEAKNIFAKKNGKEHPFYATACTNLAEVYRVQGYYNEAHRLLLEAENIYAKIRGKEHPDYARACNNLGLLYKVQGNYSQAESLYIRAKNIYMKTFGKEHYLYSNSNYNLANLYAIQQRYNEAELLYIECFNIKQKEIQQNLKNLSETEKEQYLKMNMEDYNNIFLKFIRLRYPQNPAIAGYAYQIAISTKGLILSSTEKIRQRILKSNDKELKNLFLEWKATKEKYNKSLNLTFEQRQQKKINSDSLEKRANQLEKQLATRSENFAHVFTPQNISWKDIQAKLKKDEAAIEIISVSLTEPLPEAKDSVVYLALILKKSGIYPQIVQLNNGNQLQKEYLINYHRSTRHKIHDPYSYNAYWKPIQQALPGIKTVYLSADGVYHQINLATLQNPETKKYVCDEIRIIPLTNTKDVLEKKQNYTNKAVHLIGNPKYNLNLDIKNNEKPEQNRDIENISQLEGAEKEVKQASDFFSNPILTIGESATEEFVKHLKNPRILHIATHGYFKKEQYQSSAQAMLNGGLLFAGIVDYDKMLVRPFDKDDGKLTAYEIMNMELDSTELVVLSACETGLGQVSKDGVYGLQRAFKVAGAQTIIMSLWKVSDEATQLLMTEFYQNWQKKEMDKRKAFEMAQKTVRSKYKEPYYWGAFVMIE